MPSNREGTGQLGIAGLPKEIIREFKSRCWVVDQRGFKQRRPNWQVFMEIFSESQAFRELKRTKGD